MKPNKFIRITKLIKSLLLFLNLSALVEEGKNNSESNWVRKVKNPSSLTMTLFHGLLLILYQEE